MYARLHVTNAYRNISVYFEMPQVEEWKSGRLRRGLLIKTRSEVFLTCQMVRTCWNIFGCTGRPSVRYSSPAKQDMFDLRIHKAPVLVIIVLSVVFGFLLWITGLFPHGNASRQRFETVTIRETIESTGKPNMNRKNVTKNVPTIMMELFKRGPHDVITAEIVKSVTPKVIGTVRTVRKGQKWFFNNVLQSLGSVKKIFK